MSRQEIYLGIDPGASGGMAEIGVDGSAASPMPKTERDIWNWIKQQADRDDTFAVIEKVGGYVGIKQPGSAMFKFGQSYGGLRMALIAASIPFDEVTPQVWQKSLGIVKRQSGESQTVWKNRLKAKAQQLFPHMKVTLATADALLIAEFCRRKREGLL